MDRTLIALGLAALTLACGSKGESESSNRDAAADGTSHDAHGPADAGDASHPHPDAARPAPTFLPTSDALSADALAVIVNADDPDSVAIGAYYASKRKLPSANVISVSIPMGATITSAQFAPVQTAVAAATPAGIQAYTLAFTQPYEVECMSITSAFAFGFSTAWCNTTGGACGPTALSPYYGQDSAQPFTDFKMRPTMMLAGASQSDVMTLIDRGVASDDTYPKGTAYMLITSDPARSVRGPEFYELQSSWDPATGVTCDVINNADGGAEDYITGKTDVLFYFTGLASVPDITMDTYIGGAFADHLTSFGGQVPTSSQMSAVAWLQAGATASYGTVTEPCNYTEKFPDPSVAVPRYFRGGTALQAYWKSVQWPGEGLFIGEPLAAPWKSPIVTFADDTLTIKTTELLPTTPYDLVGSNSMSGPFVVVHKGVSVARVDYATVTVSHPAFAYYRLVPSIGDGGFGD
jgi:uncharacterized protein (TIGR03790 family)